MFAILRDYFMGKKLGRVAKKVSNENSAKSFIKIIKNINRRCE